MSKINNNKNSAIRDGDYTNTLVKKQMAGWKRFFNVQALYRWNLRRLRPGFTLDIGCGIGRNLINLGGNAVGVDYNAASVKIARERGFRAFTLEEFSGSQFNSPEYFDSILLAHVAEHMTLVEVVALLKEYLHLLKPKGRLIMINPQEAGYRSDPTHIEFMDFAKMRYITKELKLEIFKEYSFPFPRFFGHFLYFNEFISVSTKIS